MKEKCKKIHQHLSNHPILKYPYSIFVIAAGSIIALIGVIMLITPGPGVFLIVLGTAILSTQFNWAKKLLNFTLGKLKLLRSKFSIIFARNRNNNIKKVPVNTII